MLLRLLLHARWLLFFVFVAECCVFGLQLDFMFHELCLFVGLFVYLFVHLLACLLVCLLLLLLFVRNCVYFMCFGCFCILGCV